MYSLAASNTFIFFGISATQPPLLDIPIKRNLQTLLFFLGLYVYLFVNKKYSSGNKVYHKEVHEGSSEKKDNETKHSVLAGLSTFHNIIPSFPSALLGVEQKEHEIQSNYSVLVQLVSFCLDVFIHKMRIVILVWVLLYNLKEALPIKRKL